MPFVQTNAEKARLHADTTPWAEAAIATTKPTRASQEATVFTEGTLLEVASTLIDRTPAELHSVRVTLPDHRHAGHRFEGPALVNLVSRARALISRTEA